MYMELLYILLFAYILLLIGLGFERGRREGLLGTDPPLGLVLRETVPQKIKDALNKDSSPPRTMPLNIPDIPSYFDCREKWPGLISGAFNQEGCSSCWAFSIALAASDRMRIFDPHNEDLLRKKMYRMGSKETEIEEDLNNFDPWHLAACNLCKTNPIGKTLIDAGLCETEACQGQILQVAIQYVKSTGLIIADCDKHIRECVKDPDLCKYVCDPDAPKLCKVYKPAFTHHITDGVAERLGTERARFTQYAIMTDGPVIIGLKIYQSFVDFFEKPNNSKKVFTEKLRRSVIRDKVLGGHSVTIIGWGTDEEGTDYWLIRNSWGKDWADEGFCKIERGINFLGCGNDVWCVHWSEECKTCVDVLLQK
jgi:hypothetical protein